MDTARKNEGLWIIEQDRDDLIFEIKCNKEFVSDITVEGIEIEISEHV